MKIRIKFRKYGVMKFIGHLDIMRYFQKAIRRAEIDIACSEGFNPHQIMSFAAPLGVGLISDGEYMDIQVHSSRSSEESMAALNHEMVEGMEITDYVLLPDHAAKSMAIVAAASYDMYYKEPENTAERAAEGVNGNRKFDYDPPAFSREEIREGIRLYYEERKSIPVLKKTKKSERIIDLKPNIHDFSLFEGTDENGKETYGFHFLLQAGSEENIKPELAAEDFYRFFEKPWDPLSFQIKRLDLFAKTEDGLKPLSFFGTRIL